MKKNLLLLVLFLLAFLSCNKDKNENTNNEPTDTTVEQDKENITKAFNNVLDCAITMRDGDVATALIEFANVSDGNFLSRDWMDKMITEELSNVIDFHEIYSIDKKFDFAYYCGTYN